MTSCLLNLLLRISYNGDTIVGPNSHQVRESGILILLVRHKGYDELHLAVLQSCDVYT